MRKLSIFSVFILLGLFFGGSLKAQNTYKLSGLYSNNQVCGGILHNFYDDGGPSTNYSVSKNDTIQFSSKLGAGGVIEVTFYSFKLAPLDSLFVFDGSTTLASGTAIDTLTGDEISKRGNPFSLYSTVGVGRIRFKIKSDATNTQIGWIATVREASAKAKIDLVTISGGGVLNSGDSVYKVCPVATLDHDAITSLAGNSVTYTYGPHNGTPASTRTYTYTPPAAPALAGYTYLWVSTGGPNVTGRTHTRNYGSGSVRYNLTVTDDNCNNYDTTFRVNVSTKPNFAGTSGNQVLCEDKDVQITGNVTGTTGSGTGADGAYTYKPTVTGNGWTSLGATPGGFNGSPAGNTVRIPDAGTTPGSYDYRFRATDDYGCTYDSTINLKVNDNVEAGEDTIINACGDNNAVDLDPGNSRTAGGTWHDLDNTGFLNSSSGIFDAQSWIGTSTVRKTATFSYFMKANAGCLNDSAMITLNVDPQNNAGTSKTITVCNSETAIDLIAELGATLTSGSWDVFSPTYPAPPFQYGVRTANRYLDLTQGGAATNPPGSVAEGVWEHTYLLTTGVCPPDQAKLTIDVKRQALPGVSRSIDVCSSDPQFTLLDSIQPKAEPSGTWTFTGTGIYGGSGVNRTFDPNAQTSDGIFTAKHTVSANAPLCKDSSATLTINFQRSPRSGTEKFTPAEICSDAGTYNLFDRLDPGTFSNTGIWSGPAALSGPNNSLVDLSSIDFSSSDIVTLDFTYFVPTTNTVCQSATTIVTVTFTRASYAGVSRNLTVCANEPIFYLRDSIGSPLPGTTVTWSGGTGYTPSDYNARFDPGTPGMVGLTVTITATDLSKGPGCMDKTADLVITVAKSPVAGDDNLTGEVCETETNFDLTKLLSADAETGNPPHYFTVKGEARASRTWLSDNGNVNLASVDFPGCGIYEFEYHAVAAACEDTALIVLDVKCIPNAGPDETDTIYICNNGAPFKLADHLNTVFVKGRYLDLDGSGGIVAPEQYASDFDPTKVKGLSKLYLIGYEVENKPCEGKDTAIIPIYVSVEQTAGIGDTAKGCSDDEAFNMYTGLVSHHEGGVFELAVMPPYDVIMNDIVISDPNRFWSGPKKNLLNIKELVAAFEQSSGTPLFTKEAPFYPPYLRFKYTVSDTNKFGPNYPLCGDSTVYLTLYISKRFATPTPKLATATKVCETDCNFNLNSMVDNLDFYPHTAGHKLIWTCSPALPANSIGNDSILAACNLDKGTYTFTLTLETPGCSPVVVNGIKLEVVDRPFAGVNNQTTVCVTDGLVDVKELLSSNGVRPDDGGVLVSNPPGLQGVLQSGFYNPQGGAGKGTFKLVYTVANEGCPGSASAEATIKVLGTPNVGTALSVDVCQGAIVALNTVLPFVDNFGTFTQVAPGSPLGIADATPYPGAQFDTQLSGSGVFTLEYTADNGYCPAATNQITLNVGVRPNSGADKTDTICDSEETYNLLGMMVEATASQNGLFKGVNTVRVSGSTYYEGDVVNQLYLIQYVTSGPGCPNDTALLGVFREKVPQAGTDASIDVCIDEPSFVMTERLQGVVDGNGTWKHQNDSYNLKLGGPNKEVFFPAVMGNEIVHKIDYTVNGIKCPADVATLTVTVHEKPKSGLKDTTVVLCQDNGNFDLNSVLGLIDVDYTVGDWTDKNGVPTTSTINPMDFNGTYTYVHTVEAPPCDASQTFVTVIVNPKPNAGKDTSVFLCNNGLPVNFRSYLAGGATFGGVWERSNGELNFTDLTGGGYVPTPAEGGKSEDIYYIKSAAGCVNDTAVLHVKVNFLPSAKVDPDTLLCVNEEPQKLVNYVIDGTGTWTIPGGIFNNNYAITEGALQGTDFYTSISKTGKFQLNYSETVQGCPAVVSKFTLRVVGPGNDTVVDICKTETQVDLVKLTQSQGIPGAWNGGGALVSGNIFNPSLGTNYGVYTVTLSGPGSPIGCSASAKITTIPKLEIQNLKINCNQATQTYTVVFDIAKGKGPFVVTGTSGTLFNPQQQFNSDAIPFGTGYQFAVSGALACGDTIFQGSTDCGNGDGDGLVDVLDKDDDNDGLPDVLEVGPNLADAHTDIDGNGVLNYRDAGYCLSKGGTMIAGVCSRYDFDGDGIINQMDLDSDNDSISDLIEGFGIATGVVLEKGTGGTSPVNGKIDVLVDANGGSDGWHDAAATLFLSSAVYDTCFKYVVRTTFSKADFLNADSDGDSVADVLESAYSINLLPDNSDNNSGEYDFRVLDADGDNISDKNEAGPRNGSIYTAVYNSDTIGEPDFQDTDADDDGIRDNIDSRVETTDDVPHDDDGDGMANHRDIDSDNDRILDAVEAGDDKNSPRITNTDLMLMDFVNPDSDDDGICDIYEGHLSMSEPMDAVVADVDGDFVPDYRDLDADGDGIMDRTYLIHNDGTSCPVPNDADGDGFYDFRELDSDNDGLYDSYEVRGNFGVPVNSDNEGDADYIDTDSDNDCIPDRVEAVCEAAGFGVHPDSAFTFTSDATVPDYLNLDSDGDGIADEIEAGTNCDEPMDTDGDGFPNFRDLDSDGDGIADRIEGSQDCDGDGLDNYADGSDNCNVATFVPEGFSPNGDGINDLFVIKEIADFPKGVLKVFNRWGGLVFESADYQNNWDGTYNGEALPNGTYFYVLDLGLNAEEPQKGYIYINR